MHGVVPAGHPQTLWDASAQLTPLAQHAEPHGVVPFSQQQLFAGSVHVPLQQPVPHAA